MIIYDGTLSIFLQDKEPLAQKGIIPHSLACASQDDFSSLLCKVILALTVLHALFYLLTVSEASLQL